MFKRQVLLECISALLIMLFLYASLSKFLDFHTFIGEMNNQPLPKTWTPFLVWFIPCSEILICAALLFERTRLLGLYASLGLMSLFTIYSIIIILNFFGRIPCSCGGVIKRLTWRQHIVLNLFYMALSIAGIIIQRRKSFFKSTIITKNSFV
jgi:putative oxidoreductase